jgi:hypothetical protein
MWLISLGMSFMSLRVRADKPVQNKGRVPGVTVGISLNDC